MTKANRVLPLPLFLVLVCLISHEVLVALEIVDETLTPRSELTTGNFMIRTTGRFDVPFLDEISGTPYKTMSFGDGQEVFFLRQYANGKKEGPEVCWHPSRLLYVVNYAGGVLDGVACIYPDDVACYSFTVVKGVLDGPCRATFTPFRFAECKVVNLHERNDDLESRKEKTGQPDYTVVTEGEYREGKKFSGDFLTIRRDGIFLRVHISKFANGIETERSNEKIYKHNGYMVEW